MSAVRTQMEAYGEPLAAQWDDLADRANAVPFLRPGWIRAGRHLGVDGLQVLTARRNGRLVGLLPLIEQGGVLRSPVNLETPEFGPLVEDATVADELAGAVFASRPRRFMLALVDEANPTIAGFRGAARNAGYRLLARTVLRPPYLVLDDWQAYQRRFDSKRLRELRRRRRRLEELGEVVVEISDGSQRLDELLEDGFRVEAAGWKGREGTAINSRPATRAFYTEVAGWAVQRGWLRLAFLRVGGRAIAFDYCFEQGDVHYLVKTGYDSDFLAYGPGILLRYEMLSRAFSMDFKLYDFLGTNEPWKLEWTDMQRERMILEWFASTPAGRINQAFRAYVGPVYRRLRGIAKETARR